MKSAVCVGSKLEQRGSQGSERWTEWERRRDPRADLVLVVQIAPAVKRLLCITLESNDFPLTALVYEAGQSVFAVAPEKGFWSFTAELSPCLESPTDTC